jgi:hypothetical protein
LFTTLERELETCLADDWLPFTDGKEYNKLFNGARIINGGANTLQQLQNKILQLKHLLRTF